MDALNKKYKTILLATLVLLANLFVIGVSQAAVPVDSEDVELPPNVESYFSLAIRLELEDYRVWRDMNKKVFRPLKAIAAEYVEAEEYAEAEAIYLRVIEISKRVYGDTNRHTMYFLSKLGWLYSKSKQFVKRVKVLEETINITVKRVGGYQMGITRDLKKLAYAYRRMGAYSKAVATYKQILKIFDENEYSYKDDFRKYSPILYELASVYIEQGDYAKAEPYYKRSLFYFKEPLNEQNQLDQLNKLSLVKLHNYVYILQFTGRYKEAETYYIKMLDNLKDAGTSTDMQVATLLSGLGVMYNQLGAYEKALKAKQKSLELMKKMFGPISPITAYGMNNLAETYLSMGENDKALALLTISSTILNTQQGMVEPELRIDPNLAKSNLGLAYLKLNKLSKAEKIFTEVLKGALNKYPSYHPIISYLKINLAEVFLQQKKYNKAALYAMDALAIANSKSSPYMLAQTYFLLASIRAAQKNMSEAVFLGKQAIDKLQSIRGGLAGTEKTLQKAFLLSQQQNYETLAGWLVDVGRLPEAETVMAMLKEDEYFNFIRRSQQKDPRVTQSVFNSFENKQRERLAAIDTMRSVLTQNLKKLNNINNEFLTTEQKKEKQNLQNALQAMRKQFKETLLKINNEFNKAKLANADELLAKQSATDKLANNVAVVYYLQLDDGLRIISRTAKSEFVKHVNVSKKDLRRNVWALKKQLVRPDKDFKPVAKKLYRWLIKPIETKLQKQGINTLLVYKKGTLRYIPLAALYDGKHFLVEKFAVSQFNASVKNTEKQTPRWNIAAMGVSKQKGKFAPLPMVPFELDNIVKTNPQDTAGIFNGQIFLDEAFTRQHFKSSLLKNFNIEHIATHYEFKPGTEADSYLLLGDGSRLDLATIRSEQYDLSRIELLTLSACETAVAEQNADGREIEGLATLVQRQGAKGVLASLWKVADCSTGKLMQQFYAYRQQGMNKANALRQTQLDFIQGKVAALKVSANKTSGCQAIAGLSKPGAAYQHPYYWAPFILMGNWQ